MILRWIFSHSRLELRCACTNIYRKSLNKISLIWIQAARLESSDLWGKVQSIFSSTCVTTLEISRLVIDFYEISLTFAISRGSDLISSTFDNWDLLFLKTIHTLCNSTHVLSISCGLTCRIDLWNSLFANTALTKPMVYFHLIFWALSSCGPSLDELFLNLCLLKRGILRQFASRTGITHGVHIGSTKWAVIVSFWNRLGWRNG